MSARLNDPLGNVTETLPFQWPAAHVDGFVISESIVVTLTMTLTLWRCFPLPLNFVLSFVVVNDCYQRS